ncbi:MAG: Dessication-associated protein [Daejeonella sp.]|nr:Dessication-associated protein [Daejeonella sp.]
MNILNILDEIEKVDGDVYERLSPRRKAMQSFFNMGSKVALAAVPLALGSMFKTAYGQTPSKVLDALNFALTLEHLEYNFYKQAMEKALIIGIPAGAATGAITTIRDHELAHVNFLKTAITGAGGTPVTEKTYDFTAKGTFPTVFTSYATFLAVAQALEDTGVRAYKGQAGELMGTGGVLTAALNIHSVEARHASHIRQMRRNSGQMPTIKPWITNGNDSGVPAADGNYAGEENDTQVTIKITGINGMAVSMAAATEAFDEPLTKAQVTALVTPFFV